jgi:transposase-like protein
MQLSQSEGFERNKKGKKINWYLRFGSVLDEPKKEVSFSKYIKQHYRCPVCAMDYVFNLDDFKEHQQSCHKGKQK